MSFVLILLGIKVAKDLILRYCEFIESVGAVALSVAAAQGEKP